MLEINIRKSLPDFVLETAMQFPRGTVALFGPSGSGKSLTLNCLAGLVKPDQGRIILNGQTLFDQAGGINLRPQQRKIGYVFQNYALFPFLTLRQNILYGVPDLPRQEKEAKLAELLSMMGLDGLEEKKPAQLSGGQQQRVALARTLITEPELILLDEPFSALDSLVRLKLRREMLEVLQAKGIPAVIVTHDLDEAFALSDFMAVVDAGQVIQYGDKETVLNQPASEQVVRLTGTDNIIAAVVAGSGSQTSTADWQGLRIDCGQRENMIPGSRVTLAIRSSRVKLLAVHSGNELPVNSFPCIMEKVTPEIDGFAAVLRLDRGRNNPLRLTIRAGYDQFPVQAAAAKNLYCHLPPESIAVIPPKPAEA